ncbi:MAG: bifunctional hydroxymethylpyrimidine kinase/phosphomethylpyrimidine kinase [Myxococcota bacterium]
MSVATALSIAGSDSGGGAGIQADLLTFAAFGVHGCSAITALTAQSTRAVTGVELVAPAFVEQQIETVLADIEVHAVKTGMLATAPIIEAVRRALARHPELPLVLDPVMVAESGARLLAPDAIASLVTMFPRARLVTPNLPELEAILGRLPEAVEDMVEAGRALQALGAQAVLVKGGHRVGDPTDVLLDGPRAPLVMSGPRIATTATHGTGCTYASAITAGLALGQPLEAAVASAHDYLAQAIAAAAAAPRIGGGKGPVQHFHQSIPWKPGARRHNGVT